MTVKLAKEVVKLLEDESTLKILTTVDQDGIPHAVLKQSLYITEGGNLAYLELLETSKTNKNMVNAIWFNRTVAILLSGKNNVSYQVKGIPVKAHISGPVFEKHYVYVREKFPDGDLAAVWIIEPYEVINQSYVVRKTAEEEQHPAIKHLDRLANL